MSARPDGTKASMIGFILIAIGVFAVIMSVNADSFEQSIWGLILANLGIGLGVLLLSLGYLVRAIWYLPAREMVEDNSQTQIIDTCEDCDWCGIKVYLPASPCSSQNEEIITNYLENNPNIELESACRNKLIERGFLK